MCESVYGTGGVSTAVIQDSSVAKRVSSLMIEILDRLNDSTAMVMELSSPEEFKAYRRAAGAVMGEIVLEILNPLYSRHPDLKPPEME